jgi:hypothetical protein
MREDPGTYVFPATFTSVVDFIHGYDEASQGAVLGGFFEWLKLGGARGGNEGWPGLILNRAFPERLEDPEAAIPTGPTAERHAIGVLFELLGDFERVRGRPDALREIFVAYDARVAAYK